MFDTIPFQGHPTYGETLDRCVKVFDYNGLLELIEQNRIADMAKAGAMNNSLMFNSLNRMNQFQHNRQLMDHQSRLLNSIVPNRPVMGI